MRLFLDTEFIEDGHTIDLISIALVAENGQEFYRQNSQADFRHANGFVVEHVLPALWPCPKGIAGSRHVYGLCADKTCVWRPKRLIRDELFAFVNSWTQARTEPVDDLLDWGALQAAEPDAVIRTRTIPASKPEFWGYYADYDWVALCQLFGRMVDLPTGWPMYAHDIKQYADDLLGPQSMNLDELVPIAGEHNALSDARWNREAHRYLMDFERSFYPARDQRYSFHAGEGHEQGVSAREVDQGPGAVRGPQAAGHGQEQGGGDLERGSEEDRQEGRASLEEREVVVLGEEGGAFVQSPRL